MKLALLFSIIIFSSCFSSAIVNMRNGSYAEKWIDIISPGSGYDLRIERYYSSRSLFIGLFGFGWCSDLETKIEHLSDGTITLSECGGGLEVTYYPTHFDKKSPTQTVDQIISYYKSHNKNLTSAYLKKLRTQLVSDTKQRFEIANKLHLINSKSLRSKKGTFVAKSKGLEEIRFNGKQYSRHTNKGFTEKFNLKGQLSQMVDKMGNWIKINYNQNNISFIVDNRGRRLNFSYNKNGTLSKIFDGRKLNVTYMFNNNNLSSVTNAWGNTYQYQYDEHHNMTKIVFPKQAGKNQFITLSYDIQNDWIKSYTDRDNCSQKFEFIMSQENPKNHYWSNVETKCQKLESKGHFEYWYKNYQHSKLKYLSRSLDQQNETIKDVYFHSYLGKPISLFEEKYTHYTGYAYKPNGLVHQKEDKKYKDNTRKEIVDWNRLLFSYNKKIRKMSDTTKTLLNKDEKPLMVTKTSFHYDKRRLLSKAIQPSGLFVNVSYNSSGKIASLTDHKKTKITFGYDKINEKPVKIKHSSIGEVFITYSPQGDVLKVSSQKGRNIASSVIQSFMDFLSILGPAAENEIKL